MPYAQPSWLLPKAGIADINYKNGNPYLIETLAGKGKLYIFASALTPAPRNNFAQHSLFVASMYRMAELSLQSSGRLAFSFQEKNIALRIEKTLGEKAFTLDKGKTSVIPAQHILDRELLLELPKTEMEAGYYDLKLGNETQQVIALNYSSQESRLSNYSLADLKTMFSSYKNFRIFETGNDASSAATYIQHNRGEALWKQAIIASLLFLLLEVLLIRFWK